MLKESSKKVVSSYSHYRFWMIAKGSGSTLVLNEEAHKHENYLNFYDLPSKYMDSPSPLGNQNIHDRNFFSHHWIDDKI